VTPSTGELIKTRLIPGGIMLPTFRQTLSNPTFDRGGYDEAAFGGNG